MLSRTRLKPAAREASYRSLRLTTLQHTRSSSSVSPHPGHDIPLDPSLLHGSPTHPIYPQWHSPGFRRLAGAVKKAHKRVHAPGSALRPYHSEDKEKIWMDFSKRLETLAPIKSVDSAALLERLGRQNRFSQLARMQFFLPQDLSLENKQFDALIKRFDSRVRQAKKQPYSDLSARKLWSLYQQFKRAMPKELSRIPDGAWRVIWRSQSQFRPADPDRLTRLRVLVEDGQANGKDMVHEAQVLFIEDLAYKGEVAEAVEQWRVEFLRNHTKSGKRKEWLELGVRMLALAGDLERACKLIIWGQKHHKSFDPRSMVFMVHRFASSGDSGYLRRAWAIYKEIKTHESFALCTDDYRTLVDTFLEGGHVSFALKVARDLATDLRLTDKNLRIQETQAGLFEVLRRCTSQEQLSSIALTSMSFLPARISWSEFFYEWMSCASQFRSQPFDTCAQVVELMFERGLAPQARHLEQMAKQWLRATESRRRKALDICWDMIYKRVAGSTFPSSRPSVLKNEDNTATEGHHPALSPRTLPAATSRTFTMLARYYAQNRQPDDALRVLELLSEADMAFSERTVRDILLTQFHLSQPAMTLCVFDEIRSADPASINLHAYSILWRTMNKHITIVNKHFGARIPSQEDFMRRLCLVDNDEVRMPAPRQLFSDTISHIRSFKRRHQKEIAPPFLLYHVILAFLKAKDPLAAFVAMRTLKEELGITPNLLTLDSIIHYTALRAATVEQFEIIRDGKHVDLLPYKNMGYTVLEHIFMRQTDDAEPEKRHPTNLYDDGYVLNNGEAVFNALEAYLLTLFQTYWGSIEAVQDQIQICEHEMGIRLTEEEEEEQILLNSLSRDVSVTAQPLTDIERSTMTMEEQQAEETSRRFQAKSAEKEVQSRWAEMEPLLKNWDDGLESIFENV